ncbi:hypothetical protein UCRPC4_g05483 [Phaeomoniella chlamydospora]|uniref:Uncharacterized protein n=1 Tax=Phaeomoniella chlamydospora TaxID=158046 RepID=A0A0G2GKS5_PHACM|nr:hypothetical protein UCRPC4_g05483 [Phaeomoniella chlamydospora]
MATTNTLRRFVKPDPIDLLPGNLPSMVRNYLDTHVDDVAPPFVTQGSQNLSRDPKTQRFAVWKDSNGDIVTPKYQYIGLKTWKVIVVKFPNSNRSPVLIASAKSAGRVTTRIKDFGSEDLQSAYYIWEGGDQFEDEPSIFKIYPTGESPSSDKKHSKAASDGEEDDESEYDNSEEDEENEDDGGLVDRSKWTPTLNPLARRSSHSKLRRSPGHKRSSNSVPARAGHSYLPASKLQSSVVKPPAISSLGCNQPKPRTQSATASLTPTKTLTGVKRKVCMPEDNQKQSTPTSARAGATHPSNGQTGKLQSMVDHASIEAQEKAKKQHPEKAQNESTKDIGRKYLLTTPVAKSLQQTEPEKNVKRVKQEGTSSQDQTVPLNEIPENSTSTSHRNVGTQLTTTPTTLATKPNELPASQLSEAMAMNTIFHLKGSSSTEPKAFRYCKTAKKLFTQAAAARLFDRTNEDGRQAPDISDDDLLRVKVAEMEEMYLVRGDNERFQKMIDQIKTSKAWTTGQAGFEAGTCVIHVTKP